MHEMAFCESVLKVIQEQSKVQDYSCVKSVWLEIGQLSSVEPEALRFCFEAASHGTLAENSALEIIETPGTAWCETCSQSVHVEERFDPCPRCGNHWLKVTSGDEMRIKELEVV